MISLSEADDRDEAYRALEQGAQAFLSGRTRDADRALDFAAGLQIDTELLAFQRRFRKIRARDYIGAPGRAAAAAAVDRCLSFRQGISPKLVPVIDPEENRTT